MKRISSKNKKHSQRVFNSPSECQKFYRCSSASLGVWGENRKVINQG